MKIEEMQRHTLALSVVLSPLIAVNRFNTCSSLLYASSLLDIKARWVV